MVDPLLKKGKGVKFSDVAGLREPKIEVCFSFLTYNTFKIEKFLKYVFVTYLMREFSNDKTDVVSPNRHIKDLESRVMAKRI